MQERRAFTLIELLVVISIIALLIALLLPGLGKMRESAMDAMCLTGVRSLTQAEIAYASENDSIFPSSGEWIWGKGDLNSHPDGKTLNGSKNFQNHNNDFTTRLAPEYGTLAPYIEDMNAHFCPLAGRLPNGPDNKGTIKGGKAHGDSVQRSYVQNWNVGPWWNQYQQFDQATYQDVKNPSEMLVIGEENTFEMSFGPNAFMNDGALGYTWDHVASFHRMSGRDLRSGYSSAGFMDGSADWIFPQAQVQGKTATEAWCSDDIPNPDAQNLNLVVPYYLP